MSPPLLSATVLNGVERGWKSIVVEARRARRWRRRKEEAKRYARHRNPWFVACSVARESAWKNLWGSAVAKDWFVRTSWVSRPSFLPLEKLRGRTRWKIYLVSGIRAKKKVLLPGKIAGTPRDLVNRWGGVRETFETATLHLVEGGQDTFDSGRGNIERRSMKNFFIARTTIHK